MSARTAARWALSAVYLAAGVLHLRYPQPFLSITPPWVPAPETVIALTGAAEVAGALGLILPRTRRAAGLGLALYALCVWPANLQHALTGPDIPGLSNDWWYHGPRLALQPAIVWWALWASGADAMLRRRGPRPGAGRR